VRLVGVLLLLGGAAVVYGAIAKGLSLAAMVSGLKKAL
jgi:hypothetical protein